MTAPTDTRKPTADRPPVTTRRRTTMKAATAAQYRVSASPVTGDEPIRDTSGAEKAASPVTPRGGKIAKWFEKMYRRGGLALQPFDPVCGAAVVASAPAAGLAWERYCKKNKALREWVERAMEGTDLSEFLMAHLPIILAVLSHHVPAFRNFLTTGMDNFIGEFMRAQVDLNAMDSAGEA